MSKKYIGAGVIGIIICNTKLLYDDWTKTQKKIEQDRDIKDKNKSRTISEKVKSYFKHIKNETTDHTRLAGSALLTCITIGLIENL